MRKWNKKLKSHQNGLNETGSTVSSLVMLLALLANAVVIGAGGYYFWHQKKMAEQEIADSKAKQEKAALEKAGPVPAKIYFKKVVPFEPVLTNLAGDNGRRILQLNLEVEVEGDSVLEEIKKLKPILRDAIVSAAGSLSFEEANKPEGQSRLKEQILQNLNTHLTSGNKAVNVFFTNYQTN